MSEKMLDLMDKKDSKITQLREENKRLEDLTEDQHQAIMSYAANTKKRLNEITELSARLAASEARYHNTLLREPYEGFDELTAKIAELEERLRATRVIKVEYLPEEVAELRSQLAKAVEAIK